MEAAQPARYTCKLYIDQGIGTLFTECRLHLDGVMYLDIDEFFW